MAVIAVKSGSASRLVACGLALAFGACNFVTKDEGMAMQQEIATLKKQAAKQDEQAAALQKAIDDANAQQKKMREVVDEATKVVTRNSANIGQDVDKLKVDVAALTGRVDDATTQLTRVRKDFETFRASTDTNLEKLTNATTVSKSPPVPETPDAVFAEAKKRFDAKQWNDARRLFDAFIARYNSDARAATAQYLIGESYFAEGKFANAIGAYSKVIDNYPKSESAPDAMYKNGLAFYALKYCGDARIYFQELLKRYPKTEWKKDATDQIKNITKDLKSKDKCQS